MSFRYCNVLSFSPIKLSAKEARKVLIDEYKDGLSKDKAIDLALKALKTGEKKLALRSTEMGIIENGKFSIVDRNTLKDIMKKYV